MLFSGWDGGSRAPHEFVCYANRRIICLLRLRQGEPTQDGLRVRLPDVLNEKKHPTEWLSASFGGDGGSRWALPIVRFANTRLCSASPRGFDSLVNTLHKKIIVQPNGWTIIFGGDGGSRTRVRKSIPETFYECSLSIIIPYETADKQAFFSVALWCVTDYRAVIRSHLLLNDTPYRAAVLPGECSPLIKQQEVLFRFCRLFL